PRRRRRSVVPARARGGARGRAVVGGAGHGRPRARDGDRRRTTRRPGVGGARLAARLRRRGPMTHALPPPPPPRTVAVVAGEARSLVRFRGRLLEAMIARGHRVHTIAPGDPPPELLARGVRHHRWHMHRTGTRPWQEVRTIARLTGILRGIAPDAVLSYSTKAMVWGALAAAVARVPNIYTMVTGLGYLFQPPAPEEDLRARARRLVLAMVTRSWFRLAFAQTRAVLVQNADDAAELRRLHVLPVGHRVVRIAG